MRFNATLSYRDYGSLGWDDFLADYAERLTSCGYVHVVDIPDGFDYLDLLARFGELLVGLKGKVVDDLIPDTTMDDVYHSGNRRALLPHTEGYEFDRTLPRYLALWCIFPARGEGGETTLLDSTPLIQNLTPETLRHLRTQRYVFRGSEGLQKLGLSRQTTRPILETVDGATLLRFSYNNIVVASDDLLTVDFLEQVRETFDREKLAVRYERNDLLHWDNWRMLHARNAFVDTSRHLKRVQISSKGSSNI